MSVRVQSEPFDMGAEIDAFTARVAGAGAVVTFSGLVRDDGGRLAAMEIEHYPGMTEKALQGIAEKAQARWQVADLAIIHRIGALQPADQIVMVSVLSAHRGDAFAACEFIMDYLKTDAPFWKKEVSEQGSKWVESRNSDMSARGKWDT
jgi:molybdopterin synthase catalytic subunit